jgi:hypothetical protein
VGSPGVTRDYQVSGEKRILAYCSGGLWVVVGRSVMFRMHIHKYRHTTLIIWVNA